MPPNRTASYVDHIDKTGKYLEPHLCPHGQLTGISQPSSSKDTTGAFLKKDELLLLAFEFGPAGVERIHSDTRCFKRGVALRQGDRVRSHGGIIDRALARGEDLFRCQDLLLHLFPLSLLTKGESWRAVRVSGRRLRREGAGLRSNTPPSGFPLRVIGEEHTPA